MQRQHSTPFQSPLPPLEIRAGTLTLDGWGLSCFVRYGKAHLQDGIGPHRRSIVVDRVASNRLERVVLLGRSGSISLEFLGWCRSIGAAVVQIGSDGDLLMHTVPFAYGGHPIRRAQALALTNGLGVTIARDLIGRKLAGQRANLVRLGANDLRAFDRLREALNSADTTDAVRLCEAKAAAIYWNAWSDVSIRLRSRDLIRVPARWMRYDSRASVLTGRAPFGNARESRGQSGAAHGTGCPSSAMLGGKLIRVLSRQ